MIKHRDHTSEGRSLKIAFIGFIGFTLVILGLLKGSDMVLFNPKGLIANEQMNLFFLSGGILLLIAIPTVFLFYYFAWKYRETSQKATYDPNTHHGRSFLIGVWAIPIVFMLVLSGIMWPATQRLEPKDAIASNAKPITIQVVAMRWKWLFIYPEQKIATVNFIQIPTNTPIVFDLTADEAPMSSFWIPHLGGQLYAMSGHVNKLNLIAESPGDYPGSSAEINGPGFAGMKFTARAGSQADFDAWVGSVQNSFDDLDATTYQQLLRPSENNQFAYYSSPEAGLYDSVVKKYAGSHDIHVEPYSSHGEHE